MTPFAVCLRGLASTGEWASRLPFERLFVLSGMSALSGYFLYLFYT